MRTPLAVVLLAAVMAAVAAAPASAAVDVSALGATEQAQHDAAVSIGKDAYTYGFPLVDFLRIRKTGTSVTAPDGKGAAPLNVLGNVRRFAKASDRTVVAPNVDTLYSIAQLDLGRQPVILKVPKMGSRYWTFEFIDPWTNVIGYIGKRVSGARGGTWAITWKGAPKRHLPRGVRTFASPYRRVWVVGRTLVNGPSDLKAAQRAQSRYLLRPLSRYLTGAGDHTPATGVTKATQAPVLTGTAFLDALGTAMAQNPPPARDAAMLARLATAGIAPGKKVSTDGLPQHVLDGLAEGVMAAEADLSPAARADVIKVALAHGGWYTPAAKVGRFGTDYVLRARAAKLGIGINTPEESMYPTALTDADGNALNGAHSYRLTFPKGQTPPNRAFWSITMYDSDGYLVDDPSHIYAVGSSHGKLAHKPDGSTVVVVSRTRPTEAAVNWLPSPAAGFRLTYCHNATLGRRDFYRQLCLALALPPSASAAGLFYAVSSHVQELAQERIHPVFLLDEAHLLHQDTLDHLHILLNYEWDSKPLLSLVLIGLSDLQDRLCLRRNRSLYSRLHTRLTIDPLLPEDTAEYIRMRLLRAGCDREVFASDALALLHEAALGSLRDIDRLATAALAEAAKKKRRLVERELLSRLLQSGAQAAA